METNLSLNSTINLYPNQFILISIGIFAIPIDILVIALVILCKTNLLRTEYYILLQLNVQSIIFSFLTVTTLILSKVSDSNIFQYQCFFANLAECLVLFLLNIIILYYSLFHVSLLSRTRYIVKLNELIRNSKCFLIYYISLLVAFTVVLMAEGIWTYRYSASKFAFNLCDDLNRSKIINITILTFELPICIAILIYSIACVFVLCSRIINKQNYSSLNENQRFKRNLILIVKFWLFSVFNFIKTAPIFLLLLSYIFCESCQMNVLVYFSYASYICYVIQPFFLILIQNILNKQLTLIISKVLNRQ